MFAKALHFWLGCMLQAINMMSDLLLIAVILFMWNFHPIWGVIAAITIHLSCRRVGGWFYSWRKKNREEFWKTWDRLSP